MSELIPWGTREETRPSLFRTKFFREFDDLMSRFFGEEQFFTERWPGFHPAIDISETDDEIVVKGEIPGIDPKDMDISLTGRVLSIKGEKKEEKEEKQEGTYRKERRFGSFSRSFTVPSEIREDKIEAKFDNGVLTIRLPKKETAKKTSIKIEI
ncbi:MAG: Hsp20/alpha crystallin family protein [Desulfomonilaceae bacterium]|nr:Hsp20/alpha crystallin family protein [Desulfomonilaceae bacterium]